MKRIFRPPPASGRTMTPSSRLTSITIKRAAASTWAKLSGAASPAFRSPCDTLSDAGQDAGGIEISLGLSLRRRQDSSRRRVPAAGRRRLHARDAVGRLAGLAAPGVD